MLRRHLRILSRQARRFFNELRLTQITRKFFFDTPFQHNLVMWINSSPLTSQRIGDPVDYDAEYTESLTSK
jgi:hypothetical protein